MPEVELIARAAGASEAGIPKVELAVRNIGSQRIANDVLSRFFTDVDYRISGPGRIRPYIRFGRTIGTTVFPDQLLPGQELTIAPVIDVNPEGDLWRERLTGTFTVQWVCGARLSNELSVEVK